MFLRHEGKGTPSGAPTNSHSDEVIVRVEEDPAVISLNEATFIWPRCVETGSETAAGGGNSMRQLVLRRVSLTVAAGKLLVVVGPVGAGKSSLLLALLGEMPRGLRSGESLIGATSTGVSRSTLIGFAPQTPVLLNGSLRANIIFGGAFDEVAYKAVLRATALWTDIVAFGKARDLTIIGERGVTLSGGQRARVGLARAAYALLRARGSEGDCDKVDERGRRLLLADDALAALDATTSAIVWRRLLGPRGLLKDVTRVIVTHSRSPIAAAHTVLVLRDGETLFCGAPSGLSAAAAASGDPLLRSLGSELGTVRATDEDESEVSKDADETLASGEEGDAAAAEDRGKGSVGFSVFAAWAAEGGRGRLAALVLLLAFLFERFFYVGSEVWLASWVAAASPGSSRDGLAVLAGASGDGGGTLTTSREYWLPGYAIFAGGNIVGSLARMFVISAIASGASARLFDRALWSVLRSPPRFFDVTPLGRILSRLSFDVDVLDSKILTAISHLLASTAWLTSAW
jgi:ATP-binding cassette subfamily C (CFTR/MRP) protein 1